MKHRLVTLVLSVVLTATASAAVFAQGGANSSLAGTVTDTSGAVLPGVTVTAKHNGTGTVSTAVTADNGTFNIPALSPGAYTVTVALSGFKTVVLNDVVLNVGVPASIRASLELGTLEETIVVEGASPVVQTTASAVSTTLNVESIKNLPITSRNVLDIVPLLPGFNTPGGNRDSTALGLPQSAINITLDGVNVQDNTLKTTDGFFTIVQPRLDAIEEVTVTTVAQGADSAGQGAVQIRFVTRSGTNDIHGSAYNYYRSDKLNANTWFNERDNIAKPTLKQNQPGVRVGGPIVRDKAFFFVNYEEFRQPADVTRNRTILHPRSEAGFFRYNAAGGVREVNLLALAAANGHVSTFDPVVQKLLGDIRAATGTTGTITDNPDPWSQRYSYNVPFESKNRYPTVRVDYNLTTNHRLSAVGNYHTFASTPDTLNNRDPFFPGFPVTGSQTSSRRQFSGSLRSTFGQSMVNEARVGYSGAPVLFSNELNPGMWSGSVANQGGYFLDIGSTVNNATTGLGVQGLGITNAGGAATPSSRDANTLLVENTLNWLKGRHSISLGGSFTQADIWATNQTMAPQVDFGILPNDPAASMFTAANFPGAAATDLTRAQYMYALLVGRVATVTGDARIDENSGQYGYLGPATQRARMRDFGFFVQDSWRMRPNLSVNLGVRYELQLPFYALNNSYSTAEIDDVCGVSGPSGESACNLFQPGNMPGRLPVFRNLAEGEHVYDTDLNNFAPSVGFNWSPSAEGGFWGKFLGNEGDTSISGGFATSFNRNGLNDFTTIFGANPGVTIDVSRSQGIGNLGTVPVLFRDSARLNAPPFPDSPQYPLTDVPTQDVNIFASDLKVPYTQSWQAGWERAVSSTMSVAARYVGTRHQDGWLQYNFNELNITENGFVNEFKLAQQNLQANIAAGRGANFRYAGPGTGTAPLPIFLAYFAGLNAAQAQNAANYSSALFANNTFLTPLARFNPQPYVAANALDGDQTRINNAIRAGLPANFLLANPNLLGGANMTDSGDSSTYHSMVLELRRRMSNGLQFQTNYVYGKASASFFTSFRRPFDFRRDTASRPNRGATEGEVTQAWKASWIYQLPFGRDRKFGSGVNAFVDGFIGGWSVTGTARVQSGMLVDLGNVTPVGFGKGDLNDLFKLRIDSGQKVWVLPQDVIDNTVKAFSVSATSATGYGSLGPPEGRYFAPANRLDCYEIDADGDNNIVENPGDCAPSNTIVTGPLFKSFDIGVFKQVKITSGVNVEFRLEILNAFNNVNFIPTGLGTGTNLNQPNAANANNYEVTQLTGTQNARLTQLVFRVNW
jgi:Carboxypeptidase regulatory-like domain